MKLRTARRTIKMVNKVRKDSKKWLCDDCRKRAKIETSRHGIPLTTMILDSDKYFCDKCSANIKATLLEYEGVK